MNPETTLPLPLFLSAMAVRTVIILLVLLVGIRVFGKRDLGELNLLDIVVVALLGNAVQNALTLGSGQLSVALVSAGLLLVADRLVGDLLVKRPNLERALLGVPEVLYSNGQLDRQTLEREDIGEDDILTAAREMGLADLSEVQAAILEVDGSISIIPKDNKG